MKANELRIGNWFKSSDGCDMVYDNWFDTDLGVRWINDLNIKLVEPIPLTEEWLLKFGFKLAYQAIHDRQSIYNFNDFQAEFVGDSIFIEGVEVNHIKYVHQFQNLYFALTQKELEIL